MYFFFVILIPIVLLAGTIGLTLAIEFPIIFFTGITRNKNYIVAVNALTNVCLNTVLILSFLFNMREYEQTLSIVTLALELTAIPIAESLLYLKISEAPKVKVWLITYLANFASFLVGLFVVGLIGGSVHGISEFFERIF